MSKARNKGTSGENWLLGHLRTVWPDAERAPLKGTADKGDFVGLFYTVGGELQTEKRSLPVEMKNQKVSRFPEWIRVIRKKATDDRWALVYKGDARTGEGQPVMVVPFGFGMDLVAHYFGPIGSKIPVDRYDAPLDSPLNWGDET